MNFGDRLVLVSCMVINSNKEILLLYKKKHGFYETPGGKVENESLENAALRELHEELGDNIKTGPLKIFIDKHNFTIPDGRKAEVTKFTCNYISGEIKLMEPEVFDHFKWIPIKDLEKYKISPDLQQLTERMKKELL